MSDFNPNSTDAILSRILQRMEAQDMTLGRIESAVHKTNGRVNALERDRWYQRGIAAAIAVTAGCAWEYVKGRVAGG
jgi:hypothetical protein